MRKKHAVELVPVEKISEASEFSLDFLVHDRTVYAVGRHQTIEVL